MDRSIGELPPNQNNLYYGYHAVDPTSFDPLFPHLKPGVYCGFFVDGECIWGDDYPPCRSISITDSSFESTVKGPTIAYLNQTAVNPASYQPVSGENVTNGGILVPQRKNHTVKAPYQNGPLRCDWEGCSYTDPFKREADLIRHRQCLHIAPRSHTCPVKDCIKVCNRQDNIQAHMRNVHGLEWICSGQKKRTGKSQLPTASLQCKWAGCYHLDGFKGESELFEHIRDAHIAHGETAFIQWTLA